MIALLVGLALDAEVHALVVVVAVVVVLAVRLVVLRLVADEVVEREAVVGGDEVDAGVRLASGAGIEVGRAAEPIGELGRLAADPLPEAAHAVAVLAVPLRPADREVADLVAAGTDVPRLGDQLHLADDRVLVDDVEEAAELVDVVQLARQRRGEVEAEAVDVHLGDPVAQRVHDQLEHPRAGGVERVAGPGVVDVVAPGRRVEPVVGGVVDAAEAERRAEVVALAGVVVDDVEDDLDARVVEPLDHRLELAHRLAGGAVADVGREEADGVVAPVVGEPALDEVAVVDVLVHRQQLDGGDAQVGEVVDRRRRAESRRRSRAAPRGRRGAAG